MKSSISLKRGRFSFFNENFSANDTISRKFKFELASCLSSTKIIFFLHVLVSFTLYLRKEIFLKVKGKCNNSIQSDSKYVIHLLRFKYELSITT